MKKYYIKFTTPIGTFSTPIRELSESEIKTHKEYILKLIEGKINYIEITHDGKTSTYLPKNVLLNSVIELKHVNT